GVRVSVSLWRGLMKIFWEESPAVDAVRIAGEEQRRLAQKRQDQVGNEVVVGEQIPVRVAGLREIHFVQVAEPEPLAINFNRDGFQAALEQFIFDLSFRAQHATYDLGASHYRRSGDRR